MSQTSSQTASAPGAYVSVGDLLVDARLRLFIDEEALPGTGVDPDRFWAGLDALMHEYGPQNRALLVARDELQAAIDEWHRSGNGDGEAYVAFLRDIGYLVPKGPAFSIDNGAVDAEIATVAGPQLVVPVLNARYALNAANARWGSLYDALYGTDALGHPPPGGPYDPIRGARVVAWAKAFLDDVVPLAGASHADVVAYRVVDGGLVVDTSNGGQTRLADPAQFGGHAGDPTGPLAVMLTNHGLGIQLLIDRLHSVGVDDPAGLADVRLEAAVTTIMDCEDSVAAVDAADKVSVYRNWLGLMRGDLTEEVTKGGSAFVRRLAEDIHVTRDDGSDVVLAGRSLMLVRNVGLLMTTPTILDRDGNETYEGLLDAAVTVLAALHDLRSPSGSRNSRCGSVYVVKPKLHGPHEARFVDDVFTHVESMLGLPAHTVKIGLMDEERRTSVNLHECIRALQHRIAFVNTGFLDRTGDEIHTSMVAGPVVRKAEMRAQPWIDAYELSNVETGLTCGLGGRAQIGKGMWAAPDLMAAMLDQKVAHPLAGANCAWVPSPTAATLHATHYHRVDVAAVQRDILARSAPDRLVDLLTIPLAASDYSDADRQIELENNAQGILGYVVRWVDQGIGCSKVPDINDVALMEDRATCRISSQHIANWLFHGLLTTEQIDCTLRTMAEIVDGQNASDPDYLAMADDFEGSAFLAARELVFRGANQPSGYTEPILHTRRAERKAVEESSTGRRPT